jgi:uncharacterized protein (DUF952 family)
MIVHIAREVDWQQALPGGRYAPPELERDGFIHLSSPEQVSGPANALYSDERGLVLLWVDPARLEAELRYEPPAPGAPVTFPHLYGSLNLDAVVGVVQLEPWKPGEFRLPPAPG